MKVLYFGHYKEGTGWAQAAIDYMLAMDSIGIDVVCRNVNLTGVEYPVPDKILELEKKPTYGAEYCIQHLLPHHLVGTGSFKKNVAYFAGETTTIKHQPWFVHLEQMDEVWVPNTDLWQALSLDNLITPNGIKVLPHTKDIDSYNKQTEVINIPEAEGKFKFYYIADLSERKNLISTLRCFHSEFSASDNVSLILKTKKHGAPPQELADHVKNISNSVKKRLRIFSNIEYYVDDIIIAEEVSGDVISGIHKYADCFLGISRGEGWSIPAFDAMAHGNTPICSNFGGPKEFIDSENESTGCLVDGQLSVCDCPDAAFPEIFTGQENWFQPNEIKTKRAMRHYYEQRKSIDRNAGLEQAKKFSYENIGNKIKEFLTNG
jgi:glycosyltransferase involved in cell wall biosynthesis